MKLLELLVKERIEWPEGAENAVQDDDELISFYKSTPFRFGLTWDAVDKEVSDLHLDCCVQCDDWQTAIVTKEQYDNACKLVDDGYTLWFGGECPVHPREKVQVVLDERNPDGNNDFDRASDWRWEWEDGLTNIIAYKVVPVKQLGVREPIGFNCRCDSVPVVTEYPAHSFLEKGVQHMKDRAAQRDSAEGERSMAACVNAFNAMFGKDLTETQGWQFMVLLKMARSRNKFNPDDYEDGAAYTGLAGEAHSHE